MNRLIIIGASGHGKVVADIAVKIGYKDIVFLDDNEEIKNCAGFSVIGKVQDIKNLEGDKIVAIGDANIREKIQTEIDAITLIHPNVVIGRNVEIGKGTVVMAGVVINTDTKIGNGCIINTSSSIDHDCIIEDYSHIAVGSHLCGTVQIGKRNWVGAGAIISNNVSVCNDCIIGAGAVVLKNIEKSGIYVGVPARSI